MTGCYDSRGRVSRETASGAPTFGVLWRGCPIRGEAGRARALAWSQRVWLWRAWIGRGAAARVHDHAEDGGLAGRLSGLAPCHQNERLARPGVGRGAHRAGVDRADVDGLV